jgi:hypothetical protein
MNWKIPNACKIDARLVDQRQIWELQLKESAHRDVTIALCLLLQGLVTGIVLADDGTNKSLRLSRGRSLGAYQAEVAWQKDGANLVLSPTELEMLTVFCLRAVRDGLAEVDHIDVEAAQPASGNVSFVFKFPVARGPVSPEEARRRLGH